MSSLNGKTVLVTGSNRGIGAAVVRELLKTGVAKVYAAARNPKSLPDFNDARVKPLALDITDKASVAAARDTATDVDVLVNNAGTAGFNTLLESEIEAIASDMNTNYYGTLNVIRAFAPQFTVRKSGTIVNVVSVVGLTSAPGLPGYSASKAALQSATQSIRAALKPSNVDVLGVYPGPIDTDMAKDLPWDKATPESAAEIIVAGIEAGETYIFPDPLSQNVAKLWESDGRALDVVLAQRAEENEAA
jgi:NAD(P)-dependent dehydrogenase (short-subunit alcohol dehydrogenase family)